MLPMPFHYISLSSTLIKRRGPSFDARVHYRKGQNVLHNYICVHYRKGQNVLHNYILLSIVNPQSTSADNILNSNFKYF